MQFNINILHNETCVVVDVFTGADPQNFERA